VLWTLIRTAPYDAVLVQGYALAALAANIAVRLRGRRCWMLVCSPIAEYYATRQAAGYPFSPLTLRGIEFLGRLNGLVGQGYVVLSEYLAVSVRRYHHGKPVEVIPVYGVDFRRFAAGQDKARARSARGLPDRGRIIFSSSRIAPEKDTTTLIEAFAMLVKEGRDVFLLNRSGGHRELREHAVRAGIGDRIIATDAADPRGDLVLDYIASDVCVQASRAEGLGFSVLEALACGTPVVASAVGGLVETIQNGVTGWTVPPGDPAALASALRDVLDHPQVAAERTEAGRRLVRERFDSEAVFARLAALLAPR
jgi:glycosyltransferase involved in cell wall biosynthesis